MAAIYPLLHLYNPATLNVFLVEIGGNLGYDLERIKRDCSAELSKLVLQDRPDVVKEAPSLDASIERMSYDFFTPQPVEGTYP